jgi:hypothetical protein
MFLEFLKTEVNSSNFVTCTRPITYIETKNVAAEHPEFGKEIRDKPEKF